MLDNVHVLYLEEHNVYGPVLKNKNATMFFLKKPYLVLNQPTKNKILK